MACAVVNGGVCELKQLLVALERTRGGGIGSGLVREVERRAQALGCHKIRLETADYQARPFYEQLGFGCVCTLTDDRFHRSWFVMEKRLGATPSGPAGPILSPREARRA